MRKINVILTIIFFLFILSIKTQYAQSGTINFPNNELKINLQKGYATFTADIALSYTILDHQSKPISPSLTISSSRNVYIKWTHRVTAVSQYINIDGKQVATNSIKDFNKNNIYLDDLQADVFSGANKINTINKFPIYSGGANLDKKSYDDKFRFFWHELLNTEWDAIEDIKKLIKQGINLGNITFNPVFREAVHVDDRTSVQLGRIKDRNKYEAAINEADKLFDSKNYDAALIKYKEAAKYSYHREQYPLDKINEIVEIQQGQNQANNISNKSNIVNEPKSNTSLEDDNINNSKNNSNGSDETSYSSSTSNSSSESSQYSKNSNNNQQAQNYQKTQAIINNVNRINAQTERNVQAINQTTDNFVALVDNIFAQQNAQAEYEREREAELERERMEKERIEREIEMAWNSMSEFENDFNSYFRKKMSNVMSKKCLYFYYGSINKYRENKSGNLKLSNIFPVYCNNDGTWPYMSDITNKIKSKNGKVIIRGYFLTETDAIRDKNNMTSKARNSYINSINSKAYYFSFNEQTESTNQNTDFWGNEKTENTNDTQKDFWGTEPSTNKSNNAQTDFWGNKVDTLKTKQDSLKTKPKNDFWK